MEGMTTSGEAVAASVSDPSSAKAVFVPFLNGKNKISKPDKRKKPIMKTVVESIKNGGMDAVTEALRLSLSESAENPASKIDRRKSLTECKKNKDKFKAMLAAKRAKQKANSEKQSEESGKIEVGGKSYDWKKNGETGEYLIADETGKTLYSAASVEELEKAIARKKDSDKESPKKQLSEAIKRIRIKKSSINEQKSENQKKRIEDAKKKILESRSKKLTGKSINESKFEGERRLIAALRRGKMDEITDDVTGKKINESFTNDSGNCDAVICGIVFPGLELNEKQLANLFYFAVGHQMAFQHSDDRYVMGKNLSVEQDLSIKDATALVDKFSAAFFAKMEELGIDTSNFDTNTSVVSVTW